ncbi:hypothetical protein D3C87_1563330 [compost metagenome]
MPLLVVINTTPLAPLLPYIAVASASFSISIDSMSEGLMLFKGLDPGVFVGYRLMATLVDSVLFIKGTPSIT